MDTIYSLDYQYLVPLIVYLINRRQYYGQMPYNQGFVNCDQGLNKPFVWPLTIGFYHILFLSVIIPLILITVGEQFVETNPQPKCGLKLVFGWTLVITFVTFVKHTVGRHRPHFYAANKIKFDADDHEFRTPVVGPPSGTNHAINKISSGDQVYYSKSSQLAMTLARESRFSFFSGHAMMGMYAATYLIIYIQEKVVNKSLIVSLIQFGLILIGLFPGITQGRTYWHHWSDVAVGHVVGTVAAYLVFYYVHA